MVLKWLTFMENDERVIRCEGMGHSRTWADVSYTVHQDMIGKMGGTITMNHGLVNQK